MDVHPRLRHGRMNKAPPTAPRAHILVKRLMQETLRSDMKETLIWATAWRNTHNPLNFHNHHCAGAARNNRVKCQATQRHGSFNIRNPSPSRDLDASASHAFTTNTHKDARPRGRRIICSRFEHLCRPDTSEDRTQRMKGQTECCFSCGWVCFLSASATK